MWEIIAALDLEPLLPTLSCPALVVAGMEDINAPVAAARQIAGLIPGAVLHEMPGAGHFPPVEMPDVFNGLLRDFLAAEARKTPALMQGRQLS
jgi:3-oxoadipate enol-lactonase